MAATPTVASKVSYMSQHSISTHGHISRVGSGAPAATGASARPSYLHRKFIGITLILALTMTTYQWMPMGMKSYYISISDEASGVDNGTIWYDDGSDGTSRIIIANVPNPNYF